MIATITAEGKHTPSQIHTLKLGTNKIGRRTEPQQQPASGEVLLDTDDASIHRQYHCIIEVIDGGNGYDFILYPFQGASNPTLLGPERKVLHSLDQIYLKAGVPFYIGENTAITLHQK